MYSLSSSLPSLFSSPSFLIPPPSSSLLFSQCPTNEFLANALSKGVYQTMITDGFLTIKVSGTNTGIVEFL